MILSDRTIKALIESGELGISPITEESIQPSSIDMRIGNHFLIVDENKTPVIDMNEEIHYRTIEAEQIVIPAHTFILATTIETIRLPNNLTAFVEGRSSIGRMGLFIQNAGWVDAGFEGQITLELYNANSVSIKVYAGRRVCQAVICQMDQAAEKPYRGKYQGQRRTVGSLISRDQSN